MQMSRARFITTIASQGAVDPYAAYTKYYVRKTGNDTTGDGSTGNPWLTINKALSLNTIPIAGKAVIYVGDGTYAENSASGHLVVGRKYLDWVVLRAENGAAGAVTITGTTNVTSSVLIQGALKTRFEYITFADAGTDIDKMVDIVCAGTTSPISDIEFIRCNFIPRSDATAVNWGIDVYSDAATRAISNILIDTCAFTQTGANTIEAIRVRAISPGIVDALTIKNSTATVVGSDSAFNLTGATNLTLTNNSVTASNATTAALAILGGSFAVSGGVYTSHNYGVRVGLDATSATATNGTLTSVTSISTNHHGMLIGGNTGGVVQAINCIVQGGDNGLVIKENDGTVVTGGTFTTSAGSAAILCKAALNPVITQTTINLSATVAGLGIDIGAPSGTKCLNVTYTNNIMNLSGTAKAFSWVTANDAGGGICDYNTYNGGSNRLGVVLADSNVVSLAELQAAWAGYGDGSNDSHSTVA